MGEHFHHMEAISYHYYTVSGFEPWETLLGVTNVTCQLQNKKNTEAPGSLR